MNAQHPAGAFLDPNETVAPTARQPDASPKDWLDSSLALLEGLQVSEVPLDSVSNELFDEFRMGRR
jgi:hypothetical protein